MAVIGTAEVVVEANTTNFERDLKAKVGKAASKTKASIDVDPSKSGNLIQRFTGLTDRAEKSLGKLGLTSRDVSVILGAGLAGGVAFAAKSLIAFGASAVTAAANLGEAQNKANVVFGDSAEAVQKFSETAAVALGQSQRAALENASTFGNLAVSMGIPQKAAADLSISLTNLASDLASLNNINPEEAFIALRAGLVGETEPLRRLGVNINQLTLEQESMRLGLTKSKEPLDAQAKLFAAYSLILKQTGTAQGDFARTAEGLPNLLRSLGAQTEDLKAKLGGVLLPTVTDVVTSFSDLAFIVQRVGDGIGALSDKKSSLGVVGKILSGIVGSVTGSGVREALGSLANALGKGKAPAEQLTTAEDLLAEAQGRVKTATDADKKAIESLSDAHLRLKRAIGDSERKVDRAELTQSRAFEDATLRIDKAEQTLARAFIDRDRSITDAEAHLADQRLEAFRSVRTARESLADFERDSERKRAASEATILDLRRQQTEAIVAATLDVQSAQRAGDAEAEDRARVALRDAQSNRDIAEAKAQLAQDNADADRERGRQERDLTEARIDAAHDIAKSQLDLARATEDAAERIKDAQQGITDAHRESSRAIFDAQQAVNDAIRDGKEAVKDARTALDRLVGSEDTAAASAKRLTEELKLLNATLDKVATNPAFQFSNSINDPPHRAHGGGVGAGSPYIVGERGPELIIPGRSGQVVSNEQLIAVLRQMSAQSSAGSVQNNHFSVAHQDPRVLANEISFRLARDITR